MKSLSKKETMLQKENRISLCLIALSQNCPKSI
jgi:hypothetical protein